MSDASDQEATSAEDPAEGGGLAPGSLRTLLLYVASVALPLVAFSLILYRRNAAAWNEPALGTRLTNKMAYYEERASEFDVVWFGDSRTYTDVHPELVDPLLGTKSLNLADFAHWFPTQYPFAQDLVRAAPAGTTAVWSIGHANFGVGMAGPLPRAYPIRTADVPRYLWWGIDWTAIRPNVLEFSPVLQPLFLAGRWRSDVDWRMRRVAWRGADAVAMQPSPKPRPDRAAIDAALAALRADPTNVRVNEATAPDGRTTGLACLKKGGGYWLVELDPSHFRANQEAQVRKALEAHAADPARATRFEASPTYWKLFVATLDLFQGRGLRLVVNEMEEAPQMYATPEEKRVLRAFMRETVRPEVERRGFAYVRADWDKFVQDDYFDWDHLTGAGATKYAPMLADVLRPVLAAGREKR